MRFFVFVLLSLTVVLLSACTDHKDNYLKNGRQVAPLVVPSDVPMIKQEPYYPTPSMPATVPKKPVSLVPPTLLKN